jgi:phosphatidate cytidylyltransferase
VGIPVVLYTVHEGEVLWLALVSLVVGLGLFEFYRMMRAKGLRPYRFLGVASGMLLIWSRSPTASVDTNFLFALILLAVMTSELLRRRTAYAVYHISTTILGVVYVAWLGSHLVLLRELPRALMPVRPYGEGWDYVLFALAVTWSTDTAAYVVGSRWGRRPLAPRISPRKTVEGAVAGLMGGMLGGLLIVVLPAHVLSVPQALGLALVASAAGQCGDLVESLIKRDVHIKDSSQTLPGHGGMLDRLDSVLFAVPVVYYALRFGFLR